MPTRSGNPGSKISGPNGRRLLLVLNSAIIATLISAVPAQASSVTYSHDQLNPQQDGTGNRNVINDNVGTNHEFNFNNVISDNNTHQSGKFDQDPAANTGDSHDPLQFAHGGTGDDGVSDTKPHDGDHGTSSSSSDGDFKLDKDEGDHHGRDDFGKDGDHCVTPAAVPIPATAWLLGSGLLGLIGIARRKPVTT